MRLKSDILKQKDWNINILHYYFSCKCIFVLFTTSIFLNMIHFLYAEYFLFFYNIHNVSFFIFMIRTHLVFVRFTHLYIHLKIFKVIRCCWSCQNQPFIWPAISVYHYFLLMYLYNFFQKSSRSLQSSPSLMRPLIRSCVLLFLPSFILGSSCISHSHCFCSPPSFSSSAAHFCCWEGAWLVCSAPLWMECV